MVELGDEHRRHAVQRGAALADPRGDQSLAWLRAGAHVQVRVTGAAGDGELEAGLPGGDLERDGRGADGGGADVFVHISAVEAAGLRSLSDGQKISFEEQADKRSGKMSAVNLKVS